MLICVTDDESEEEDAPLPKTAAPSKPAAKATPAKLAAKAAPAKEESEDEDDGVYLCGVPPCPTPLSCSSEK